MIGKTLQSFREQKGFSVRDIAAGILSPSQVSKIENNSQIPSVDKFIHLLYRLNITFDEFCMFIDDDYMNSRIKLNSQAGETLRKRNVNDILKLIETVHSYFEKYNDIYFYHTECVLKASYVLLTTNNDYDKARKEVAEVANYLFSIKNWFYYELSLLNNILFFFEIDVALTLGDRALRTIEKQYAQFKDNEITRRLLNNLAIYALKDEQYYMKSYHYSSTALGLPQSTQNIYSTVFAKIINQVACYKLQNGEYNHDYLSNLINWFSLIHMEEIQKKFQEFVEEYGITLDKI